MGVLVNDQAASLRKSTPDAFESRCVEMRQRLYAYALGQLRHHALAEDIAQTTLMKAIRSRHQFEEGTNLEAWIYTILRNQILTHYRRQKHRPVQREDLGMEVLACRAEQESTILSREVMEAVRRLIPGQRDVCVLTIVDGLGYEEIAARLKIRIGTVKSRLWRARAALRKQLGEEVAA